MSNFDAVAVEDKPGGIVMSHADWLANNDVVAVNDDLFKVHAQMVGDFTNPLAAKPFAVNRHRHWKNFHDNHQKLS